MPDAAAFSDSPAAHALLHRAAAGDSSAVAEMMEQHGAAVVAWLSQRMPPAEAADLVHDVFLPSRLANFSGASTVRTFLIGVAKHRWHHWQRAVARHQARGERSLDALTQADFDPAATQADAADLGAQREFLGRLRERVFELLDEREAVIFELRYLRGLEFSEIAARLGESNENTLRSQHRRALQRLRHALGGWLESAGAMAIAEAWPPTEAPPSPRPDRPSSHARPTRPTGSPPP